MLSDAACAAPPTDAAAPEAVRAAVLAMFAAHDCRLPAMLPPGDLAPFGLTVEGADAAVQAMLAAGEVWANEGHVLAPSLCRQP